ncbi:MAG: phosphoribosylglycinamide formyltransferase [Alphaproteobacteria bacterium PA2]|nr:MAG: phosphoribosylglycinamide formyltransferase [Alphaproteobacteria bacterium PA2]
MTRPLKLGFLASRNGTSFRAIVEACAAGQLEAEPRLLVTNTGKAEALEYARGRGLACRVIPTAADAQAADQALCDALSGADVDLVILSGYLRRLGPVTLSRFRNRVLNIHPGPLPEFGGEGMYGRRVHEAVIASGITETCATIHLVDEIYDHGAVIERAVVGVLSEDTAVTLEARVAEIEPKAYVAVLSRIISGDLTLPD